MEWISKIIRKEKSRKLEKNSYEMKLLLIYLLYREEGKIVCVVHDADILSKKELKLN